MKEQGRVLAVFAHPDDETYGPGATLARLSAEGAAVHLITLTRGESATMGDSPLFSPGFLAEIREKELECACLALGISHHEIFGFPDKGLVDVPQDELAAPVLRALERFSPHLVITFHQEGVSGHQDHRTVSTMVKKALAADGGGPPRRPEGGARLAYYVVPESIASKVKWRQLNAVPDKEVTHAIETEGYQAAKAMAAECHKTQRYIFERLSAFPGGIGEIWKRECFIVQGEKPGKAPRPRLPLTP